MQGANVRAVCTTDDPIDDLAKSWNASPPNAGFKIKVLPAFRPDRSFNIDRAEFVEYIPKLAAASGVQIQRFDDVRKALSARMDFSPNAAVGSRIMV